ncbi:hypothetical protein ACFL1Y_01115 [Patescibacteria group bacterium]
MKTLLKIILILIIIILVLAIVLGFYIWFKNPLGLRGIIENKIAPSNIEINESYNHPLLDATQEKQLRDIGVDPANIPTEITPEQQKCLESKFSQEKINAILDGEAPSALDVLKAMPCL